MIWPKMIQRLRLGTCPRWLEGQSGDRLMSTHSNTALNSVKLVLETLSGISQSIPFPGVNLPFSSLLNVIDRVQVSFVTCSGV